MTAGVADLPMDVKARALLQVQRFAGFQRGGVGQKDTANDLRLSVAQLAPPPTRGFFIA
jgi:hypothetical protein